MLHGRSRRTAGMDRLYNLQAFVAHLTIVKRGRSAGRRFNGRYTFNGGLTRARRSLDDELRGHGNAPLLRTKMQIDRWIHYTSEDRATLMAVTHRRTEL